MDIPELFIQKGYFLWYHNIKNIFMKEGVLNKKSEEALEEKYICNDAYAQCVVGDLLYENI